MCWTARDEWQAFEQERKEIEEPAEPKVEEPRREPVLEEEREREPVLA